MTFDVPLPPDPDMFVAPAAGQTMVANVTINNTGEFPTVDHRWGAMVLFAPRGSGVDDIFTAHEKEIKLTVIGGPIPPHMPETKHLMHSFQYKNGATVTKLDADGFNAATLDLCVIGKIIWSDETGTYQTNGAYCLAKNFERSFNFYMGSENGRETKLK
jgi:hypothetical protein